MGQIDINGAHCFDDAEAKMENKLIDNDWLQLLVTSDERGERVKYVDPEHVINMATEILALRADAETSQNHNAAVIDPLIAQLRDAGFTGTLSEMVGQACYAKLVLDYDVACNHILPVPPEGGA
jgi:hypothetical protein